MNIAMITDELHRGGGPEHLFQVARAMGHVRFLVFAKGGAAGRRLAGLENVHLYDTGYAAGDFLRLAPDVIHFHHLKPLLRFIGETTFSSSNIPLVFTAHGLHVHKYTYQGGIRGKVLHALRSSLERHLFTRVERVIAVSEEDHGLLEDRYGLKGRAVHIPNGIDPETFDALAVSKGEAREALNLPPASTLLLTAARFDEQKGYDVLIRAIHWGRSFFKEHKVRFLFSGDGGTRKAMKRLAARLGVTDCITFLGERDDVALLMKASDLLVLPSRWEGLPLTLLEAAACNLPVVASDTGGNREVVRDGCTGWLFENENHEDLFQVLARAVGKRETMEETPPFSCQGFRQKYHVSNACRMLESLYRDVLSESGSTVK